MNTSKFNPKAIEIIFRCRLVYHNTTGGKLYVTGHELFGYSYLLNFMLIWIQVGDKLEAT